MRSMFTIEEVAEMMDMKPSQVKSEIDSGNLGYSIQEGEQVVTLYDLEKYMGGQHAMKLAREFLNRQETKANEA